MDFKNLNALQEAETLLASTSTSTGEAAHQDADCSSCATSSCLHFHRRLGGAVHARPSCADDDEDIEKDVVPLAGALRPCPCRNGTTLPHTPAGGREQYIAPIIQNRPCKDTQGRTWRVLGPAHHAALRPLLETGARAQPFSVLSSAHCLLGQYRRSTSDRNAAQIMLAHEAMLFTAHQDCKIRVWKKLSTGTDSSTPDYQLLSTLPTRRDYLLNCFCQKNYAQVRRHHQSLWIQHVDAMSSLAFDAGKCCDSNVSTTSPPGGTSEPLLYSASWDKTIKVWRLSDFKCIESVAAHDDAINAIALASCCDASAPYQKLVFTASSDATVKAWAKEAIFIRRRCLRRSRLKVQHKLVATLAHPKKCAVNALAISNDGELLLSAGSDGLIRLWRRAEDHGMHAAGQQVSITLCNVFEGHKRAVLCLSIVGDLLLSGSADKTVRVWSIQAYKGKLASPADKPCLAIMQGHKAPVRNVCAWASLQGCCYTIYSGDLDEAIKVRHLMHDLRRKPSS